MLKKTNDAYSAHQMLFCVNKNRNGCYFGYVVYKTVGYSIKNNVIFIKGFNKMKITCRCSGCLYCFWFPTAELWVAQSTDNVAYHQIRKKYDYKKVNDTTALSYVDLLIALAKKEKNYSELTYAYQDALHFEPSGYP